MNKSAYQIAQELQKSEIKGDKDKDDDDARAVAAARGGVGRRNTVHNLMKAQKTVKKEEPTDLEKKFKQNFKNLSKSVLYSYIYYYYVQ